MDRQVVVIGGGLGGLSGAIRLAHRGFHVRLFEQNSELGGKMGEITQGGYRFDIGPSLLTMPFVLDELFASVGQARLAHVELVPLDPLCRYFFADGTVIDARNDLAAMQQALRVLSAADAEAYPRFLAYAARIYRLTAGVFLFTPFHEIRRLARLANLRTLLRLHQIDPFRTVHQGVARFFEDARVIQLFDRYATYNGSNPYRAPATLNVIAHVEYGMGGFYIKGGMYRLVEALARLATATGVDVHTSARVDRILHRDGRVEGVVVNGERFPADSVLCGADVVAAHNDLIEGFSGRRRKLNRLEPSLSGLIFCWGVRRQHDRLRQHNILFSADYRREFSQIFDERRPPDDPTIYIAITSKSDPDHAPPGGENWFVLLNMPYLAAGQDWPAAVDRMRERVFHRLRQIDVDLANAIEREQVFTPEDIRRLYGSNRGSIYGISSNSRATAFRRPPNRSRDIRGLYFAGGSSHPGGGIPLVLASGRMASDLIAEAAAR
jgi:phytoene desaturase